MQKVLDVMKNSAKEAIRIKEIYSVSGLIGGDAYKLEQYLKREIPLTGDTMVLAMAMALSSSEVKCFYG